MSETDLETEGWIPPISTPPPTDIDKEPENPLETIVETYEEKFKTFSSFGIWKKDILKLISNTLLVELNVDIGYLFENDFESFNMIIAAFFGRSRALYDPYDKKQFEETDFLADCLLPLHTVIVMCYAAHYMRNMFVEEGSGLESEQNKYEALKNNFEDIACRIIDHIYYLPRKGPERARAALQADYDWLKTFEIEHQKINSYTAYFHRKFNQNKEIMAIAYKAEAMKFLSQKPCLYLMKIRYKCEDRKNKYIYGSYVEKKIHQCIVWCLSMQFKLWFHAIFRLIYIFMFAYMLCRVPVYNDHISLGKRDWKEKIPIWYVLAVLQAQFTMTSLNICNYFIFSPKSGDGYLLKLSRYYRSNRLAMWRIFLISFIFGLEAVRFLITGFGQINKNRTTFNSSFVFIPLILEWMYCILFIISAIATLRFFYSIKSLGFFTHLIRKMLKTVGTFVFIFCAFWFVLAVTHVSISRSFSTVESTTNYTFFHTIVSQGKFEIFGEVKDEDRTGNLTGCSNYDRTIYDIFSMDYEEASCLFRSSVMPFLMFLYIFMAGILLVNLLTAQLTKEYEKEAELSRYYYGYLQYEQLCKIESKIYLPPPLSIVYIIFVLLLLPFSCCAQCFRFICETIVKQIDGDPYQAVKTYVGTFGAEAKVEEFLRATQKNTWKKMKNLLAKYEQEDSNFENIMAIQTQLNLLLNSEKNREIRRETYRSGGGTSSRMKDIDSDDPAVETETVIFM